MIKSIDVEQDANGEIIISDQITFNYGVGRDFISALVDYCETVLEWYALTTEPSDEYEPSESTVLEQGNYMKRRGWYARS